MRVDLPARQALARAGEGGEDQDRLEQANILLQMQLDALLARHEAELNAVKSKAAKDAREAHVRQFTRDVSNSPPLQRQLLLKDEEIQRLLDEIVHRYLALQLHLTVRRPD